MYVKKRHVNDQNIFKSKRRIRFWRQIRIWQKIILDPDLLSPKCSGSGSATQETGNACIKAGGNREEENVRVLDRGKIE
jgi:hypothetical protein